MKKVIYIWCGVSVAFGNVINAGCCCKGNKDEGINSDKGNGKGNTGKKLPSNLGIYIGGEALVNKNDYLRNDRFKEFARSFKVNKNDFGTDVSMFSVESGKTFVFVCTKMFYDKQCQSIKNDNLSPISNTEYYACCIEDGNLLAKAEFHIDAVKGEPGRFEFERVVNILLD